MEGATLFNYLNAVRLQGITGSIALQGRKRGNKSIRIVRETVTCKLGIIFQAGTRATLDLEVKHYNSKTNEVRIFRLILAV